MKKRIAVIGSDGQISADVILAAEKIGQDIAEADCILICGGRGGVMEAACRGAKKNGGLTVGILPSLDGRDANQHLDVAVTTGMGFSRNSIVASSADAVIAVSGSTGTLSEIAMAMNAGRPVIAVTGVGGVSETVKKALDGDLKAGEITETAYEDAVASALNLM